MCKKSDSIIEIAKALCKFNGEIQKIEKDSTNPHFKNKYASLDNIIDEIRPILTKHGLSIIQMPGGDGENFKMSTLLIHESGEWIESDPIVMKPVKNDPQGIGSCATYARRYSLSAFLSLNTGDDDDGNDATQPTRQPYTPSKPTTQSSTDTTLDTALKTTAGTSNLISEAQVKYSFRLKGEKKISDDDFKRIISEHSDGNMEIKQLTKTQASVFINFLTAYIVVAQDDLPF